VFQHITAEDGLTTDPDVNIFQDTEGFYWFNAFSGVQRFDGKKFVSYRYNYIDSRNMTDNIVTKPVEDEEKNIWFINKEGINIFYRVTQQLKRLYMPDAIDSNSNNVAAVVKDNTNVLWIFTSKNVFKYNYATRKPVLVKHIFTDKNSGLITALYNHENKRFYLLAARDVNKIYCLDSSLKQTSPKATNVDELLGHRNPVSLFKLDNNNNLWIANYIGDLCKYNISTSSAEHYSILHQRDKEKQALPNSALFDFTDDGKNTIWFCGDNYIGLLQYNKLTDNFSQVQQDNASENGLHYTQDIFNLFRDNAGNIWVNTDLGMNVFNPALQQFHYLNIIKSDSSKLFSSDITCIYQSRNEHIWITTWGDGIFEYDSNFNLLKNYIHNKNEVSSLGEPLNRTWCITEDAKGRMWVGSQYGILSILDTASKKFINKNIAAFNAKTIMHLVTDKKNNVWLGMYDGILAKWNTSTDSLTIYKDLYENPSYKLSIIEGLCIDKDDNIWAATGTNGLNRFNQDNKMMDENVIFPEHVFSPVIMNDSIIIGGTSGKGLFLFNKFSKKTHFYTTANGLSSNVVYGALPGYKNDVWVLESDGMQRLSLADGKVSSFTISDGIHDHVFQRAFCKLKNGVIMVASNSGVIYFDPTHIKTKPSPTDVVITGFAADQHDLSVDSLLLHKSIVLKHDQNVITIEFASLSFSGRKTNEYFYNLEGADKNWMAAGMQRSITYANLLPGHYVFKVKAQNPDGAPTKNITELNITIKSPWWQTWWASLIWLCIAAYIIYKAINYRRKNREALAGVRQKIASDLHDDIGSTLNSISVYSEIAGKQLQNDAENAKIILDKIGKASRNMIDVMNDIVWAVHPKNDQFENVLQRMQYFAGELLSGKNILLRFEADERSKNMRLPMEKRKNFYLIFKEAVTNAYKYSGSKTLHVKIYTYKNILCMVVADEGEGFGTTKMSLAGNGLKNMQQRAEEINADLNITSSPQKGTAVQLKMPLA
jgi:ligand-binding sensor domain-containing protein/two-component sensor histidine kinase